MSQPDARPTEWRRPGIRAEQAALGLFLALFVAGHLIGLGYGLADNGDFVRTGAWFAPNPVGLEEWVDASDPSRDLRFFDYWLPRWDFDPSFNPYGYFSSAILLWAPGVALNLLFYSREVILLPIVSLVPRIALLALLILVARWLRRREPEPLIRLAMLLGLGVPLTMMSIDIEYTAYFNSWYQDGALVVFTLAALVAVTAGLRRDPTRFYDLLVLGLVGLAATSKASGAYLPLLLLPLVVGGISRFRSDPRRGLLLAVASVIIVMGALYLTDNGAGRAYNAFNSLYHGVLELSDRPAEHLSSLGLDGTEECVGLTAFTGPGAECLNAVSDRMSHLNTMRVLLAEPALVPRSFAHVARRMQVTELEYLGKLSVDADPRSPPALVRGWSVLKKSLFPRGPLLWVALAAGATLFVRDLGRSDLRRDLAPLGLLCIVGVVIEMGIGFLGDGGPDPKHLLMANVFFDLALILALGSAARAGVARIGAAQP